MPAELRASRTKSAPNHSPKVLAKVRAEVRAEDGKIVKFMGGRLGR